MEFFSHIRSLSGSASSGLTMSEWSNKEATKEFPNLDIVDKGIWEVNVDTYHYELDLSDEPPLNAALHRPILARLFASLGENKTVTLLTVPTGMSINKFEEISRFPKVGRMSPLNCGVTVLYPAAQEIGNIYVDKTYRVAIANDVLAHSDKSKIQDQKFLVEKIGYEAAKVLPVIALVSLSRIRSAKTPFQEAPVWNTVRCLESVGNQLQGYDILITPSGIHVHGINPLNENQPKVAIQMDLS